jgi:hypothetical protein
VPSQNLQKVDGMRVKPLNYADAGGLSRLESATLYKQLGNLSNVNPYVSYAIKALKIIFGRKDKYGFASHAHFYESEQI